MPDVVGKQLDVALSDIERAGVHDKVEVLGGGALGVVNKKNWQVCDQLPAAGTVVTEAPRLTVDRSCGTSTGQGASDEPTTDAAESAKPRPTEATSKPQPTEATSKPEQTEAAPEPEPTDETPKVAQIGDTVRAGDLAVKVASAARKSKLSSVFGSKKGHWMLVTVKVTNKGKDQVMVNDSDFTLIEADGTSYSTDSDGMTYIDSDDWLFLKKINPKTSATGKVLFAIPKSAKNLTLRISSGFLGLKTAEISLGKV